MIISGLSQHLGVDLTTRSKNREVSTVDLGERVLSVALVLSSLLFVFAANSLLMAFEEVMG